MGGCFVLCCLNLDFIIKWLYDRRERANSPANIVKEV